MTDTSSHAIADLGKIKDASELLVRAKWLEGKTLAEISNDIKASDDASRVQTKGDVGYVIEQGFFGIKKNSGAHADIEHLGIEIKTCPLKRNKAGNRLAVKEPLSLNVLNYVDEAPRKDIKDSSLYKKNRRVLFVVYVHDKNKDRSEYLVKYVFLWEMDERVLSELRDDYNKILEYINAGKAHEIHQWQHKSLTLCPKHSGDFSDPNDKKSRTRQPFSDIPAEIRAYRLKSAYMNRIITRQIGKDLGHGGWLAE